MTSYTSKTYTAALEEAAADWDWLDGALCAEFLFADFNQAFAFMQQVAELAEKQQHHPDWQNSYNRVVISLRTHDQDAVTGLDVALAKQISMLYTRFKQP